MGGRKRIAHEENIPTVEHYQNNNVQVGATPHKYKKMEHDTNGEVQSGANKKLPRDTELPPPGKRVLGGREKKNCSKLISVTAIHCTYELTLTPQSPYVPNKHRNGLRSKQPNRFKTNKLTMEKLQSY